MSQFVAKYLRLIIEALKINNLFAGTYPEGPLFSVTSLWEK
jgi:hypothetical protein